MVRKTCFIYLFLPALGLHCYLQALSLAAVSRGYSLIVMCGFHILVTLLVEEHCVQVQGLQQLQHTGLVAVAHGLRSAGLVVVSHCTDRQPM